MMGRDRCWGVARSYISDISLPSVNATLLTTCQVVSSHIGLLSWPIVFEDIKLLCFPLGTTKRGFDHIRSSRLPAHLTWCCSEITEDSVQDFARHCEVEIRQDLCTACSPGRCQRLHISHTAAHRPWAGHQEVAGLRICFSRYYPLFSVHLLPACFAMPKDHDSRWGSLSECKCQFLQLQGKGIRHVGSGRDSTL